MDERGVLSVGVGGKPHGSEGRGHASALTYPYVLRNAFAYRGGGGNFARGQFRRG